MVSVFKRVFLHQNSQTRLLVGNVTKTAFFAQAVDQNKNKNNEF